MTNFGNDMQFVSLFAVDLLQILHIMETTVATVLGAFQHGGTASVHVVAKTWKLIR